MTVSVLLHDPPPSSALEFFARISPAARDVSNESKLLQSIRTALRGSDTDPSPVHQSSFSWRTDSFEEDELTWSSSMVVLSTAGVMKKRWCFVEEGQHIQWACFGWLEQTIPSRTEEFSSSKIMHDIPGPHSDAARPTFGPFARHRRNRKPDLGRSTRVPSVFVFLRSVGKVFLKTGEEYTFTLPFIVRKAWPLFPHGVMVQRVLEPGEFVESESSGDPILPTIFSLTNPVSEASTFGETEGIAGGFHNESAHLRDESEHWSRPLKSPSPTEMAVWTSPPGFISNGDFLITVDARKRQLSIWRYAFIKPKSRPKDSNLTSQSHSSIDTESQELPPLSSLPGRPPALTTTTTLASLVTDGLIQRPIPAIGRRQSLSRNDLSVTMDRMVLGGRIDVDSSATNLDPEKMRAVYWMQKLYTQDISSVDEYWRDISVAIFDDRWDGGSERFLLAICLPQSQVLMIFSVTRRENTLDVIPVRTLPALSIASASITRDDVQDLLFVKPDHSLALFMQGMYELPIDVKGKGIPGRQVGIMSIKSQNRSSIGVTLQNGMKAHATLDFITRDSLTQDCLHVLSITLPPEVFFMLHKLYIEKWSQFNFSRSSGIEFTLLIDALYSVMELPKSKTNRSGSYWHALSTAYSHQKFQTDPAVAKLTLPPEPPEYPVGLPQSSSSRRPHPLLAPVLYSLHTLAENLRLSVHHYRELASLVPVLCTIALAIRPEWADYWRRLCPNALKIWPSSQLIPPEHLDDRIPVWPPDLTAILYGKISNPEWHVPWLYGLQLMSLRFGISPAFAYGRKDPLLTISRLAEIYKCLSDNTQSTQKRAENAVSFIISSGIEPEFIDRLPLGIASPIREATRTCQLAPPADWPLLAYQAIGRNDLAASATDALDVLFNDGYKSAKNYINPSDPRRSIGEIISDARLTSTSEPDAVTGTEINMADFTGIRFGQDRRLEEVARMLRSSNVSTIKVVERPDLNEHDQGKEHQNQAARIAERTLALPYGRAMFTFGSAPTVTREAYTIPKMEYSVRIMPLNITVTPDNGKLPVDSTNWGEFHNGVAAGLRISPYAGGIESSWIAFNKPSELTPEHAGFLFGLGLTGHLKGLMSWYTFNYLTPKHDPTSIGILLGLSAANIGSSSTQVTKLLAVHTPALLPTPDVDLNISLMIQAAGLSGIGLLYLGTKNRRMAEVCLTQISRKDLVQPELSNEHREAYTYAAALAFGMIMVGKGSSTPADIALVERLTVLVNGDTNILDRNVRPSFDVNLTSPAATMALGLMYLRTERKDVADVITIPDTVLELNRIQPSFLLIRTVARSLIMWNNVAPTMEWCHSQLPPSIKSIAESRSKGQSFDDAQELAYYNILAGACFAIGLKYAGTARQAAYRMIIHYFDIFTRLVYTPGPAFDHKIKRSAFRDGLNLISISLSMVMAGTGEITCFRRLRYAYGMYQQAMYHHPFKYGVHVATHMSIGLLFLGGGRFTLGTSDAAIASLVVAFFPRVHQISSDNKSYLQALRHLWVIAVEPRCLIARDVDTSEVVYLPVKIKVKEGNEVCATQLISPTLIPDLDKLLSIRVDTPRYWPFYLDTEHIPRHKENLLRNQTLFVKRRTAFLSYTEDPRGSRSLFVRSGSSAGDTVTLDYPQLTDATIHPASDMSEFITSFSNDPLFLAFADYFTHQGGKGVEQSFYSFCHAALLDSILQDKPQTLQSHMILYHMRTMTPRTQFFHLKIQDLRFAADFYGKVYDRRFSGHTENNARAPLLRDSAVASALYALDQRLEAIRSSPRFMVALGQYARGERVTEEDAEMARDLAWYLLRNGVPVSTLLMILRNLAQEAHAQCIGRPAPHGTDDANALDLGIKEVLHGTGTKMTTAYGSGWSVRSLDEIIAAWNLSS